MDSKLKTYKTRISRIKNMMDRLYIYGGIFKGSKYEQCGYYNAGMVMDISLSKKFYDMEMRYAMRMDYKLIIKEENNCIFFCIDLNQPKYMSCESLDGFYLEYEISTNLTSNADLLEDISKEVDVKTLFKCELNDRLDMIRKTNLFKREENAAKEVCNNTKIEIQRCEKEFLRLSDQSLYPVIILDIDRGKANYCMDRSSKSCKIGRREKEINELKDDDVRTAFENISHMFYLCRIKIEHSYINGEEYIKGLRRSC